MLFPIPKTTATPMEGEVKIPLLFFVQRIQRYDLHSIYFSHYLVAKSAMRQD